MGIPDKAVEAAWNVLLEAQSASGLIGGYSEDTTRDMLEAARVELTKQAVDDALAHALHPEFGSEWDRPDGQLYKLTTQRDEALAELTVILKLHSKNKYGGCMECGGPWPCRTAQTLGVEPDVR